MITIISVTQFHKELKNIAKETRRGKSFLVMNRTEPIFRIEPVAPKSYDKELEKSIKKLRGA